VLCRKGGAVYRENDTKRTDTLWAERRVPIRVAALSKSGTVFTRSSTWIVGSNPTEGMDVYVRVAPLRRADSPSKESYRLCIGLRN
jgi:hypothetical protein